MKAFMARMSASLFTLQYRILADKDGTMNMDPFSYLKNNKVSSNSALQGMGASLYQLLKAVGIIGVVLSIMISGLLMMLGKGKTREEGKSKLMTVSVICIAIFSFIFLAGQVLTIANNFT